MFKFNKRSTYMYFFICIFLCTNAGWAERAEQALSFNEETIERIEALESIEDVDLDIYLDVGVHNDLWQNIVEELDLEEKTELATYLEDKRSLKKMSRKFSRYLGKKIQKVLAKYANLDSIKTVDEMAYAVAHFKLSLNRYIKTGKIESNFKLLDYISRDNNKELAQQFKSKAIFYYNNKNVKPYLLNMLCDRREIDYEKNKEAGIDFPPELIFASFCMTAGTALGFVPIVGIQGIGAAMAGYGTVMWCQYVNKTGSDSYREYNRTTPPK